MPLQTRCICRHANDGMILLRWVNPACSDHGPSAADEPVDEAAACRVELVSPQGQPWQQVTHDYRAASLPHKHVTFDWSICPNCADLHLPDARPFWMSLPDPGECLYS